MRLKCVLWFCKVNDCAAKKEYNWQQVHEDLESGKYAGVYGWDNAAYWGLAEHRAGVLISYIFKTCVLYFLKKSFVLLVQVDLAEFYKKRTADECFLPEWEQLLRDPKTQESTLYFCFGHVIGMLFVYGMYRLHSENDV